MSGTYHDYYTVALAPAVAGLVAVAGRVLWLRRTSRPARLGLALTMIITAGWAFVLLGRSTTPYDALGWPVLVVGVAAAGAMLAVHLLPRALAAVVLGVALVGAGAGPSAYALQTAATPHTGSIVTAGPVAAGDQQGQAGPAGRTGSQRAPGGSPPGATPGGGPGQAPGQGGAGAGGGTVDSELTSLLSTDANAYTWVAATDGAQSAAPLQLATGHPVLAIGGFTRDPSPTLAEFQQLIAERQIHYYVSGGNGGGGPRGGPAGENGSAAQIAAWVSETYTATTAGGVTVYDLAGASS